MTDAARRLSQSHDVRTKVAQVLETRTKLALECFNDR